MKKIILSIIILFYFTINVSSHVDHYADFNYLEYELFRNNKSIGFHNYQFQRKNNNLTVKSIIEFKITKMGVDLYKYDALSEEQYELNQLIKFSSTTNQNKKKKKYTNYLR